VITPTTVYHQLPLPLPQTIKHQYFKLMTSTDILAKFPPGLVPLIIDYVSRDGVIGNFGHPHGMVMVNNLLYVADTMHDNLRVFRTDGTLVSD